MHGRGHVGTAAAHTSECDGEVYSNDNFNRCAGVHWVNPLASGSHASAAFSQVAISDLPVSPRATVIMSG